jgi:site-specific DNA-methyltransferase (cytosine-N4-specific)
MSRLLIGDCRDSMRELIREGVRVQTCVTSPPYWGLRDYGVAGQLGLESTIGEYVGNMVGVFALVRELLADDGTLWLNLGDSYANDGKWGGETGGKQHYLGEANRKRVGREKRLTGLKPKDLCGIPWRIAFALQADGWYLRQDIIWHKPNPMPESIKDRCTKAHEYLFLLAKSERYYYNADAIKEKSSENTHARRANNGAPKPPAVWASGDGPHSAVGHQTAKNHRKIAGGIDKTKNNASFEEAMARMPDFRNKRSVWTVASAPYSEAHFATYPPALIEPCILAGSKPGDIVFDPFIGSGTTGEVAQRLGRDWIGCELNPEYAKLVECRVSTTIGMAI